MWRRLCVPIQQEGKSCKPGLRLHRLFLYGKVGRGRCCQLLSLYSVCGWFVPAASCCLQCVCAGHIVTCCVELHIPKAVCSASRNPSLCSTVGSATADPFFIPCCEGVLVIAWRFFFHRFHFPTAFLGLGRRCFWCIHTGHDVVWRFVAPHLCGPVMDSRNLVGDSTWICNK